MNDRHKDRLFHQPPRNKIQRADGFTMIEVIIALSILIILCYGVLSVFSYVAKINNGENLRAQALSVLQKEVEYYRSLKFVPIGTSTELNGGTYNNVRTRTSADGKVFNVSVTIDNNPSVAGIQTSTDVPEVECKFKEIKINVVPQIVQSGWLSDLKTDITIQRVRSN